MGNGWKERKESHKEMAEAMPQRKSKDGLNERIYYGRSRQFLTSENMRLEVLRFEKARR